MDSEIRAIMAQYMPLDNQGETSNQVARGGIWYSDFIKRFSSWTFVEPTTWEVWSLLLMLS